MTTPRALDREAAKQNPEGAFESPLQIIDEVLLTAGEKAATLERWRRSILGELNAASEGMPTRGYTAKQLVTLKEIEEAQRLLKGRLQSAKGDDGSA